MPEGHAAPRALPHIDQAMIKPARTTPTVKRVMCALEAARAPICCGFIIYYIIASIARAARRICILTVLPNTYYGRA